MITEVCCLAYFALRARNRKGRRFVQSRIARDSDIEEACIEESKTGKCI